MLYQPKLRLSYVYYTRLLLSPSLVSRLPPLTPSSAITSMGPNLLSSYPTQKQWNARAGLHVSPQALKVNIQRRCPCQTYLSVIQSSNAVQPMARLLKQISSRSTCIHLHKRQAAMQERREICRSDRQARMKRRAKLVSRVAQVEEWSITRNK